MTRPFRAFSLLAVPFLLIMASDQCFGEEGVAIGQAAPQSSSRSMAVSAGDGWENGAVRINGELTLEDAVKLALTYNWNLKIVVQERGVAEGLITQAWGEALPVVSLNANYTRLDEVPSFEIADQHITIGSLNNYSAGVTIDQPVFRGGAVRAGLRAAELYESLTDEQIRGAVQEVVFATVAAYYRAQLSRQEQEVAQSYLDQSRTQLADVQSKKKYGVASEFNVLRAEVDVANSETELIRLSNNHDQALAALLITMGASQDSSVTLADEPEYHPLTIDEERAVERALADRPDVLGAEIAVGLQEQAVAAAKSRYWPELDAFFTYGAARPDPHIATIDDWGDAWSGGLKLRWTIFDRGRTGILIQERAVLEQQRIGRTEVREVAKFDVRSAHLNLINADRAVMSQRRNLERATEGQRLANVSYREGTIDQVSLLDATTALAEAGLLYYRSIFAHAMSRLELRRATGLLAPTAPPGAESIKPTQLDVQDLLEVGPEQTGSTLVSEPALNPLPAAKK